MMTSTQDHAASGGIPQFRFSTASDHTLKDDSNLSNVDPNSLKASQSSGSNPLKVTFSQQLDAEKLPIATGLQNAVIGGKYIQEESVPQEITGEIKKFEFDMPLTYTEVVDDKGDEFIQLAFVSGDKEDPFNWPEGKKTFISAVLCLMTLFIGLATTAYSSGIGSMVADLNTSEELGQMGLFLFNITCAIAPLMLAPFCELVGRRIIYAGSFVGFSVMFIGLALGKNIATILVCRTILGLFGCVGTILVGGTFSDMYPSEKRAVPIATFSFVAIFGTVAAPIYAGFIDQTLGWRWIEAIQGFGNIPLLIVILFFFRETRGEVVLQKRAKILRQQTGDQRYVSAIDLDARNVKDLLHAASVKAIHMLVTESVVFAFGLWIAFAWFLTFLFLSVIPITFEEKKGWNHGVGGLPYIGLCIGVTLAYIANFWQMKHYRHLLHDPSVVVVPEHRLYGAMVGGVWLPVGLFIYSFTQYADLPWIAPVIGLIPISFGIFFIFEGCYSYTSDCYGDNSSSAIAGQGLMRNALGAVAPLFASQFFHKVGSQYAGLILALVASALTVLPFVLFKYGSTLRFKSTMADCPERNLRRSVNTSFSKRRSTMLSY